MGERRRKITSAYDLLDDETRATLKADLDEIARQRRRALDESAAIWLATDRAAGEVRNDG